MSHRQKVDHLIEELGRQGVGSYTAAPPLFRLLWTLGFEVPPPFFLGFRWLAILFGSGFALLWGVGMWLWEWQELGLVGVVVGLPSALLAGMLFGLVMAWLFRRKASRLGLPSSWEDYPQA